MGPMTQSNSASTASANDLRRRRDRMFLIAVVSSGLLISSCANTVPDPARMCDFSDANPQYQTVAGVLTELKDKDDVEVHWSGNWKTYVDRRKSNQVVVWNLSSPYHPSHPSLWMREYVRSKGGEVSFRYCLLCESTSSQCRTEARTLEYFTRENREAWVSSIQFEGVAE